VLPAPRRTQRANPQQRRSSRGSSSMGMAGRWLRHGKAKRGGQRLYAFKVDSQRRNGEELGDRGAPATHAGQRRPWQAAEEETPNRTSPWHLRRRERAQQQQQGGRSGGQDESGNGGEVEEHDDGGDGAAVLLPLWFVLARRAEAKRKGRGMRAERVRTGSRGRVRPWGPPQPRVGRRRTPTATGRAAPDRGRHGVGTRTGKGEGDGAGEAGPTCRAGPVTRRQPDKFENAFLFPFQI
jgi:hypothetical protein